MKFDEDSDFYTRMILKMINIFTDINKLIDIGEIEAANKMVTYLMFPAVKALHDLKKLFPEKSEVVIFEGKEYLLKLHEIGIINRKFKIPTGMIDSNIKMICIGHKVKYYVSELLESFLVESEVVLFRGKPFLLYTKPIPGNNSSTQVLQELSVIQTQLDCEIIGENSDEENKA